MSDNWAGYEPLIDAKTAKKFTQAMMPPTQIVTSTNLVINPTTVPKYDKEYEVRKVVKTHSNKEYFYVISVSENDVVFYQIYHGGWFSKILYKLFGENPNYHKTDITGNNTSWGSIRKRTHLPATIGATYLEIDKAIELYKAELEHDNYAKELLDVEPDNLKMIEGLEKLAEGEPETEIAIHPAASGGYNYTNQLNVIGSGSFYSFPPAEFSYDSNAGPVEDPDEDEDEEDCDGCPDCEDTDEFGRYVGR